MSPASNDRLCMMRLLFLWSGDQALTGARIFDADQA